MISNGDFEEALLGLQRRKRILESELAEVESAIAAFHKVASVVNPNAAIEHHHSCINQPNRRPSLPNVEILPERGLRENIRRILQATGRPMHYKYIYEILVRGGLSADIDSVRITCYQLGPEFETERGHVMYNNNIKENLKRR